MNRNFRGFFIPILILFLFPAIPLKAKNYEIEKVHIFAQINKDGSVNIREERTYNFHGSFSWANYILPKKKFQGWRISQFQRTENFMISGGGGGGGEALEEEQGKGERKEKLNQRNKFICIGKKSMV